MTYRISDIMTEEEKTYKDAGTVTMSVDRLMDLTNRISKLKEALIGLDKECSEECLRRIKAETEIKELTEQVKRLTEKLDSLNEWFDSEPECKTKYKLFLADKALKEQEEED